MTIEQLKRAKEIQDEVNKITINLTNVKKCAFNDIDDFRLAGFKVRHVMSKDHPSKVIITRNGFEDKIFDSVSAAHKYYFGY